MSGKLWATGFVTNAFAGTILGLVGWGLDLWTYVAVALGMQMAVFIFHAFPYSSEKFYDLSGSATHFAIVFGSLVQVERVRSPRQILVACASIIWMTRLGTILYLRISRDAKDGRFDKLKTNFLAWIGCWTLQACWVTLVQLPVILLNNRDDLVAFGPADYVCALIWVMSFLLESSADNEKMVFRANPANRSKFINQGVWRYSRHPNYFGEIMMWTSIAALATIAAAQGGDWRLYAGWISPAFTCCLLLGVSGVPMVEAAGMKKWGTNAEYLHYTNNTSCVIPWFPAGAGPVSEGSPQPSARLTGDDAD